MLEKARLDWEVENGKHADLRLGKPIQWYFAAIQAMGIKNWRMEAELRTQNWEERTQVKRSC